MMRQWVTLAKQKLIWLYMYLMGPVPERYSWKSEFESILSHVGYTIGLGNMWRFPYYCFKYEGATFLIPYGVCLIVLGLPMIFVDVSLGQFMSLGPTNVFANMAPLFSGLGWSMVMLALLVCIYYNVVMAWTIIYLYSSFKEKLPWTHCENEFNTQDCQEDKNISNQYSASEQFFKNYVLRIGPEATNNSTGWSDDYSLHPEMVLSLAVAWVLVLLSLVKGIRSSGKVVHVTVTFPYAVLLLLLAWNSLKGAWGNSIHQYFSPTQVDGSKLLDLNLWTDAAAQVLFSLGAVFGAHMTMSSYNKLEQNVLRDSFIIVLWDTATSFLCGCVVFTSVASGMDMDVKDIFNGNDTLGGVGVELVFIAYPALLGQTGTHIWSVLFFLMILTLGLDSMIGRFETISTALFDNFVRLRQRYLLVVFLVCFTLFLLGMPMCTRKGVILVELMHMYTCKLSMFFLGLLKIVVICYIFGFSKLMQLIRQELGVYVPLPLEWYFALVMKFLCPLSLGGLLVYSIAFEDHHEWDGAPLPWACRTIGWILASCSCAIVPAVAIKVLYKNRGRDWRELLRPTSTFLPQYVRQEPEEPDPTYVLNVLDSV